MRRRYRQAGEECDDGNGLGGDFCDGQCRRECVAGNGNIQGPDSCYMRFDQQLSFLDAMAACASVNAHLASIDSAAENDFVYAARAAGLPEGNNDAAWIGLTDSNIEGRFQWFEMGGQSRVATYLGFEAANFPNQAADNGDDCVVILGCTGWCGSGAFMGRRPMCDTSKLHLRARL